MGLAISAAAPYNRFTRYKLGHALALTLFVLFASAARAKARHAPLCRAGFYTASLDLDSGAARCRACQPGMVTAADAEGWTSCVAGEADWTCPPGSGYVSSTQGIRVFTCVPCLPNEESVVINGWSVCLTLRCTRGTVPVRIPGAVTDYECVPPIEKAVDWNAVMPPGRDGSSSRAPECPGGCLRYQVEGRSYYCSRPAPGERVVVRLGRAICESALEGEGNAGPCGAKRVPLRGGKCAACPPKSHFSLQTGYAECIPDARPRPPQGKREVPDGSRRAIQP